MFDTLNTWWSGVISAVVGITAIISLRKLITAERSAIVFDYFSGSLKFGRLPSNVSATISVGNEDFDEVFVYNALVKNETNEAITDTSFTRCPRLELPSNCKLLTAELAESTAGATVKFRQGELNSEIELYEITIPIGGTLCFEIVASGSMIKPIIFTGKNQKVKPRQYGRGIWRDDRAREFGPLPFFLLVTILALSLNFEETRTRLFANPDSEATVLLTVFGLPLVAALILAKLLTVLFPMNAPERDFSLRKRSNR